MNVRGSGPELRAFPIAPSLFRCCGGMLRLDDDSLLATLDFLRLGELLRAESTCRRVRTLSQSADSFWLRRLLRQFGASLRDDFVMGDVRALSKHALAVVRRDPLLNLLEDIVAFSSVDREEEGPRNVLRVSRCYRYYHERLKFAYRHPPLQDFSLALFQMHCGCANGSPCYWSSRPSHSPERVEAMELKLTAAVAIVTGMVITPYQAFFQPAAPVYAPRTVVVKFKDPSGRCYFESEPLAVLNRFVEQRLDFSSPALFLGGTALLELRHMVQRQTLEGLDDYYMCISYLRISGFNLSDFDAECVGDVWWLSRQADPRRWVDRAVKWADSLDNDDGGHSSHSDSIDLMYL